MLIRKLIRKMVNSSLTYEILMYLNSFYFGMFAACELGMGRKYFFNFFFVLIQVEKNSLFLDEQFAGFE